MEFLQTLLENNNIPILSALILGLMTSISPCPLATNITATSYISKNIGNKRKVFINGLFYAVGRAFSYTSIGVVLYFGASKFHIARFFSQYGEKFLGPLLIIIGLLMLNLIRINLPKNTILSDKMTERFLGKGYLGSFLIGVVFALAFCPYSGALFFGILIPMTITGAKGLYLPAIFAIGTGLPVIIFTYLLAFTASKIGIYFSRITKIERVMRLVTGIVFIITGLYYVSIFAGII